MNEIVLNTDGACQPNPGHGAWCCIIQHGEREMVVTGTEEYSTNNRMEIMGLCKCLPELAKNGVRNILVVSDSKYLGYGLKWMGKKRKRLHKQDRPNKDLWMQIHDCIDRYGLVVRFKWVRGHHGHVQNERCNYIAEGMAGASYERAG